MAAMLEEKGAGAQLTSGRHEAANLPAQPLAAMTFENRLRMRSSKPSQTSR